MVAGMDNKGWVVGMAPVSLGGDKVVVHMVPAAVVCVGMGAGRVVVVKTVGKS